MANLLEVLVTCDTNNTLWTCSVWDPHNGTSLMTYRAGGTAEPRTLSFVGQDYVAAVEKGKPVLHVWPANSHQPVQGIRFILPGKASAFAISNDGMYCVAGIDEKIFLWQIASGSLLTIINRHYQKIGLLKFTPDGKYFVSAAEDGMVMVWDLVTVAASPDGGLVSQSTAGQHDPVHIFSDHSLPVTDLCISKTGMHGRLCTVSSDRTCKIYELASGEMLLNLVFDVALLSVTFDVLELSVFVGSTEGKIFQFNLTNPPRNRDLLINTETSCATFTAHSKGVTCLSVSLDGESLMSGGNDEKVIIWHIHSRQPIRTLRHKGPITNAFYTVNIPAIYKQEFEPNIILHSLDRTLEKDSDSVVEIEVLVNTKNNFWPEYREEVVINTTPQEVDTGCKKQEEKLQAELDKLKKINADLYSFSVHKALDSVPIQRPEANTKKKNKKKKSNK